MFGNIRVNRAELRLLLLAVFVIITAGCRDLSEDSIEDTMAPAGPRLLLDTHYFNAGSVPAGSTVNETIFVRNIGNAELIIETVYGINSVASVAFPERPLLPGETSDIRVSLDVPHQNEIDEQHIVVISNDVLAPRQNIVFIMEPVLNLGVNPGRVWLGRISGLEPVRDSFEIHGSRIPDLIPDAIRFDADTFDHRTTFTIQDTRGVSPPTLTAHIEFNPAGMKTGRFSFPLVVHTGLTDHPELSVFITGTVSGPYISEPHRIYFGQYIPGETVSQPLSVTRIDGRPFKVLQASIDQPDYHVTHIRSEIQDTQSFLVHFHSEDRALARQRAMLTIVTDADDFDRIEIPLFTFLKVDRPE
jgi:hypothetical protein